MKSKTINKLFLLIVIAGMLFMAGRTVYNAGYRAGVRNAMKNAKVDVQGNTVYIEVYGETWKHSIQ